MLVLRGRLQGPVKLLKFWQNLDKASDAFRLIEQLWRPPALTCKSSHFVRGRVKNAQFCDDFVLTRGESVAFVHPHFQAECHCPNRSLPPYKSSFKFFSLTHNMETTSSNIWKKQVNDDGDEKDYARGDIWNTYLINLCPRNWGPMVFLRVWTPNWWLE